MIATQLVIGSIYEVYQSHLVVTGEQVELRRAGDGRTEELNIVEEGRSHLRFLALLCAVMHQ